MSIAVDAVDSLSGYLGTVAPLAVAVLGFVYFFRNPFLLRHYLWQKLMGSPLNIKDPDLKQTLQKQLDLNQARAMLSGFRFQNYRHLKAVLGWCNHHRIDYEQLGEFGSLTAFDGETLYLQDKDSALAKACNAGLAMLFGGLCLVAILWTAASGLKGAVVVVGKESNSFVYLEGDRVTHAGWPPGVQRGWQLAAEDCKTGAPRDAQSLTEGEFQALCELIGSERAEAYVKENFHTNFYFLLGSATVTFVLAVVFARHTRRLRRFTAFKRRLGLAVSTRH